MKNLLKYVDKQYHHKDFGRVLVTGVVNQSRTKVIVEEIDRGEGYSEKLKKYVGVRVRGGWKLGENLNFGKRHEAHVKELINLN